MKCFLDVLITIFCKQVLQVIKVNMIIESIYLIVQVIYFMGILFTF